MYEARYKGKISAYTVLLGRLPRLPSSYMPFAYRYPTNLLQCPDRTAFMPAALMLSCLGTATYMYMHSILYCMYIHSNVCTCIHSKVCTYIAMYYCMYVHTCT